MSKPDYVAQLISCTMAEGVDDWLREMNKRFLHSGLRYGRVTIWPPNTLEGEPADILYEGWRKQPMTYGPPEWIWLDNTKGSDESPFDSFAFHPFFE